MGNIEKCAARLFQDSNEASRFIDAIEGGRAGLQALVWMTKRPAEGPFRTSPVPEWAPPGVDVVDVSEEERPGIHALHAEGSYYVLDMSSVFAARPLFDLAGTLDQTLVIDLCAAPGGKSALAFQALHPGCLLANEAIGKRVPVLISNLKRCAIRPSVVTCADSGILSRILFQTGGVVVVDVPCSGQSLVAKAVKGKGKEQRGAFHPATVNLNSNRQKRIVANAAQLVAGEGYLLYMTCTFSREENEAVVAWLLDKFPQFQPVPCRALDLFQSAHADFPCYRLFPHYGFGAGAFTCLLRNTKKTPGREIDFSGLRVCWRND